MDDLKNIIAKNIISLRTLHNLTQLQLGEMLNYSDKAVSKWERGEGIPDAYILSKLSAYFNVSVDYLMTDRGNDRPIKPARHNRETFRNIMLVSFLSVWTLGLMIFVGMWIAGNPDYMVFVYTLPPSLIVLLVLNSIWGKAKVNLIIISALVWSVIAVIYLSVLSYGNMNIWMLFLLGIPAEFIMFIGFRLYFTHQLNKLPPV